MITLQLKIAFQQPGCPLCYLRNQTAQRYLRRFLWENVNDVESRTHLVRSLGFCPLHAWQLQRTEEALYADGLGTGIVYEDLATRALEGLEEYLRAAARSQSSPPRRQRWEKWLRWLRERFAVPTATPTRSAPLPPGLTAQERCRVCVILDQGEETYLIWLINGCLEPEFQEWYSASDGLCLPHLRQALVMADPGQLAAARFLAQVSRDKLAQWTGRLREYLRKHSWQYHEETMLPEERSSWIRVVAFFAGERSGEVVSWQEPSSLSN